MQLQRCNKMWERQDKPFLHYQSIYATAISKMLRATLAVAQIYIASAQSNNQNSIDAFASIRATARVAPTLSYSIIISIYKPTKSCNAELPKLHKKIIQKNLLDYVKLHSQNNLIFSRIDTTTQKPLHRPNSSNFLFPSSWF
jgi:hypothetical protein